MRGPNRLRLVLWLSVLNALLTAITRGIVSIIKVSSRIGVAVIVITIITIHYVRFPLLPSPATITQHLNVRRPFSPESMELGQRESSSTTEPSSGRLRKTFTGSQTHSILRFSSLKLFPPPPPPTRAPQSGDSLTAMKKDSPWTRQNFPSRPWSPSGRSQWRTSDLQPSG